MKKRDYIEEIISIKDRSKFYGRFELLRRLRAIDSIIYDLTNDNTIKNKETLKYIPIATVTCFESYLRSVIAELIDKGEPYYENVSKFNQSASIKFDFNIVNAIQKKKISVGDLVSHLLNCNSIKDFNSNLSTLTQTNFFRELKKFNPKPNHLVKSSIDISNEFQKKHSKILESINYIFRLRHILCHEFATNIELDYSIIKEAYENCKIFLFHVDDYIGHLIEPNAPLTQSEMNIRAGENFKNAEFELNKVIEKIKSLNQEKEDLFLNNDDFEKVIEKWKEYRDIKAESFAKSSLGGSIYPILRLNSLTSTTEKMTSELIEEYKLDKIRK